MGSKIIETGVSSSSSSGINVKTCTDCGTTKTPLWRGGPAGPKSLCNACGIRSRKKRRALLGLNKGDTEEKKFKKTNNNGNSNSSSNNKGGNNSNCNSNSKLGDSLKRRLMALGREVVLQRSMVGKKKKRQQKQMRKLGEEEQAAVLLMALSCGSVYA